jgi:hypothetical protein
MHFRTRRPNFFSSIGHYGSANRHHIPARARRIAGLSGVLTFSQSRDGPDR